MDKFTNFQIVIVGSGIGGSSLAHFLDVELTGANIDIYEMATTFGGRVQTINMHDRLYDCGASIIHPSNKYLVEFRKKYGLKKRKSYSGFGPSIYNGVSVSNGFLFKTFLRLDKLISFVQTLRFIIACGVIDFIKLYWALQNIIKKFTRIYTLQGQDYDYNTIEDLLKRIQLYKLTQITLHYYVTKCLHLSSKIYEILIVPALRVNYGQDPKKVPALVGLISLAAMGANLWSFEGGNRIVIAALLKSLNVKVGEYESYFESPKFRKHLHTKNMVTLRLNAQVERVEYDESTNKYQLTYVESEKLVKTYDMVFIATPMKLQKVYIPFKNSWFIDLKSSIDENTQYHKLWVNFLERCDFTFNAHTFGTSNVIGKNYLYPYLSTKKNIYLDSILTSPIDESFAEQWNSASHIMPVDYKAKINKMTRIWMHLKAQFSPSKLNYAPLLDRTHDSEITDQKLGCWKIFSNKEISEQTLTQKLFEQKMVGNESKLARKEIIWHAYPDYKTLWNDPSTLLNHSSSNGEIKYSFPPIIWHQNAMGGGVYHLNSIEWLASTMETSCISAKNCSLLALKHYKICSKMK